MKIQENINLAQFSSFHIGGSAKFFCEINNESELVEALNFAKDKQLEVLILGSGSNVVFNDRGFAGLVIKINIKGIEVENETDADVIVKAAAGEIWDDVVKFAVDRKWWGIENLSLIPGQAGAAPVQNIGAYGQEVSSVIEDVVVLDRRDMTVKTLNKKQCDFGYRKSIFNTSAKEKYIILEVIFKLQKNGQPKLNYPDLSSWINQLDHIPSLVEIRHRVIAIRQNKFANPEKVGTAGSFFKNLYLSEEEYKVLAAKIGENFNSEIVRKLNEIKNKFISDKGIKIPTAFLIDQVLGLKGEKVGGAEISKTQALVIINPKKQATATDVLSLFKKVRQEAYCKTGMVLENEPKFVGFTENELKEYYSLPDC